LLLPAPTPSQVADSRRQSGLSQAAMAESLGLSGPARIAEYESGKHAMPAAVWSFWLLVCGQHPRH
jgi:predicted transcriptional regulator